MQNGTDKSCFLDSRQLRSRFGPASARRPRAAAARMLGAAGGRQHGEQPARTQGLTPEAGAAVSELVATPSPPGKVDARTERLSRAPGCPCMRTHLRAGDPPGRSSRRRWPGPAGDVGPAELAHPEGAPGRPHPRPAAPPRPALTGPAPAAPRGRSPAARSPRSRAAAAIAPPAHFRALEACASWASLGPAPAPPRPAPPRPMVPEKVGAQLRAQSQRASCRQTCAFARAPELAGWSLAPARWERGGGGVRVPTAGPETPAPGPLTAPRSRPQVRCALTGHELPCRLPGAPGLHPRQEVPAAGPRLPGLRLHRVRAAHHPAPRTRTWPGRGGAAELPDRPGGGTVPSAESGRDWWT